MIYPPEYISGMMCIYSNITTRRGILNKRYEAKAMEIIVKMKDQGVQGIEYLTSDLLRTKFKTTGIYRELGKFPSNEIPGLIIEICGMQSKQKRTIREWERLLKSLRLHPELLSETVSDNQEASQ